MDFLSYVRLEPSLVELGSVGSVLFLLLLIAILVITGLALFKSARLNDTIMFWVMFIFGTAGIVPLIYLYIKRFKKPYYIWRGKK